MLFTFEKLQAFHIVLFSYFIRYISSKIRSKLSISKELNGDEKAILEYT